VIFNGELFESPNYCSTLRQAEHAAAEVALNVLFRRGSSSSQSLAARFFVRLRLVFSVFLLFLSKSRLLSCSCCGEEGFCC
jgi:hypothetical protein